MIRGIASGIAPRSRRGKLSHYPPHAIKRGGGAFAPDYLLQGANQKQCLKSLKVKPL